MGCCDEDDLDSDFFLSRRVALHVVNSVVNYMSPQGALLPLCVTILYTI